MVWNIDFQIAGLILSLMVVFMSINQKKLNFTAERIYFKLVLCIVACICFDIGSVFAINYRNIVGEVGLQIVCKAYLFNIVLVTFIASHLAVAEMRYRFRRGYQLLSTLPLIAEVIVFFLFPVKIHCENGEIYSYGVPVLVTYAFSVLFLVASFIVIIVFKDNIATKRRNALLFWIGAWIITAAIQFANNHLLLVSYGMAVATVYMYLKLENPEYHLDFATNVFNNSGFRFLIKEALKQKERKSIVTFRVGDLGAIAQVFGKKGVNSVLTLIAEYADKCKGGTVFRIDDDTFCITFDDNNDAENAMQDLIERFDAPWVIKEVSEKVDLFVSYIDSISYFRDVDDLLEVIYYFAEESTRRKPGVILAVNEFELSSKKKILDLQHTLEWAIHNDGVEVYFQPIYSIKEGKFCSMEALARIRDENGNILSPVTFIEFAEKNGMILKLGEIIFKKTCEFMQRMKVEKYGIEFMEVNLSVVQCMQEDLAKTLKTIMSEYGIPPYKINFEITETAAIYSKAALSRNMKELLDYGSGFSLDDYGSGYSNLSYVVGLPVNIIKIDKELVDSFFTSEKVKIATEYTIEMIHKLGMRIVVEGVETEEQYLVFKKLNVEYIQGYYFSKPLPSDKVLPFIQEWM